MPSAPVAHRRLARLLSAFAVGATAVVLPLVAAAPARAGTDGLSGGTVTGQLVQAYPESADETHEPAAQPLSWVQPASGEPVRLDTADLADVPVGATVRVTLGKAVHDGADGVGTAHDVTRSVVLAASPTEPTTDGTTTDGTTTDGTATDGTGTDGTTTAPPPTTPTTTVVSTGVGLTDRVTVVLVEAGGGAPDATTAHDLIDAVDGDVHDFWSQQTGGAVDLGVVSTTGWVATTADCGTPTKLWDQAAAAAGFVDGPGNHLLVYVSGASTAVAGCDYGLAEIGSGLHGGGRLYVEDTLPSLIAHELGHNFGLGHSSGRQCDGTVDTGRCRTEGYRDYYDVMGASWEHVGTLTVAQEARLGVLPAAQRRTFDAAGPGGTVGLAPLSGRSGVRALELTASDGTGYWLEYRAATGQDAWLDTPADRLGLEAGVLLHRSGALPDTSLLLDGTPSAAPGWDADLQAALPLGRPVVLADGFTVTVTALTPAAASIAVTTTPDPAVVSAAAPPSAARVPGRGCRTCAQNAPSSAATSPPTGAVLGYTVPRPAASEHRAVATAKPMALAALHSTSALSIAAALVAGTVLLAVTLARRLRRSSPGSRSRARTR